MKKLRVQRERDFSPHHVLLGAASTALDDAEAKRPGYFNYELMAITFSALALEAICNAFGEKLLIRWEDFESSGPIAKLRTLCNRLDITVDFDKDPWSAAIWLVRFRNKVAHAKPEFVREDRVVTHEEHDRMRFEGPQSKLERNVSLSHAQRAVDSIISIQHQLCERLPEDLIHGLIADGWSGSASEHEEA